MDNIGKNIGILCRQLNLYLNHSLENCGVTATEIMYLGSLLLKDGVSQEELAKEFSVDKAAVARTLQSMENKGLVTRTNDAKDKRSKLVYITESALQYKDTLLSIQNNWYHAVIDNIDDDSREIFGNVLESIVEKTRMLNN